jgi:multicomponent Na+:H+ antiporter subunit E
MRRALTIRRVMTVVGLVFTWCALWGELSVANLASGTLVAVGVLALGVGPPGEGGVRPAALGRFVVFVALDLVRSTAGVVWEVLTPTDRTEEAVIGVNVSVDTSAHLLLMIVAVTLTPGTAVIDADSDRGVLYLHLLHADRADGVIAHVERLADLACQALPVPAATASKEGR